MHDDKPKPAGRFSQHYRGEPQPAAMVSRAEHERRVTELLEANNRYLERARAAEAGIAEARAAERRTVWAEIEAAFGPQPTVGFEEPYWPIDGFEIRQLILQAEGRANA
jgi:hypothetical protein